MTQSVPPQRQPELLAPAGSLEAFFAAMEFGADAVYVGLKDFSARAKAKNFNRDELERMLAYAHARQRKVYLTLNTLIKERELSLLIDLLSAVEAMGVDALIIQDLAIWRLARQHFPGLELHASTQLTVHNAAGVQMLEKMGFSRVVLARELSLAEIAAINRQTTLDLEHFVHGAHCFSLSGQCSFSSWLGGMSGNRGRCAQPCRRRYSYREKDGYYFSPNDLSAIELLPELVAAGVMSLKIEGRMKSAEYVANVVQAYRQVLDAEPLMRPAAIETAKELIRESFGRTPTRGFLPGGVPNDIVNPGVHGATGRLLGRIEQVQGGTLSFVTGQPLHVGDRVRIQPASDQAGTAFTIRELRLGNQPVKRVNKGGRATLETPPAARFKPGDRVFKVASGQAFNLSQSACRKRLDELRPGLVSIDLAIGFPEPERLRLEARWGGQSLTRSYPVESFPATERPLDEAVLQKVFAKTGQTPFQLGRLRCGSLPAVVIRPSELNAVRREFYQELEQVITEFQLQARTEHRRQAMAALLPGQPEPATGRAGVTVGLGNLRDLSLLRERDVDSVLLPLAPGASERLPSAGRAMDQQQERIVWDLPLAIFEQDWAAYRDEVERLLGRGFRRFRLQNIGQFELFAGHPGLALETGYRLFTTNSQAALAWRELGVSCATLFVEDDRDNLGELLRRDAGLTLAVTVFANLPMMVSRMPVPGVKADRPLLSDRGDGYRVESHKGLAVVRPEQDFSLLGHLKELQAMGCRRFILDLSHSGPSSPRGRQVLAAWRRDEPLPDTSTFNYLKELT